MFDLKWVSLVCSFALTNGQAASKQATDKQANCVCARANDLLARGSIERLEIKCTSCNERHLLFASLTLNFVSQSIWMSCNQLYLYLHLFVFVKLSLSLSRSVATRSLTWMKAMSVLTFVVLAFTSSIDVMFAWKWKKKKQSSTNARSLTANRLICAKNCLMSRNRERKKTKFFAGARKKASATFC